MAKTFWKISMRNGILILLLATMVSCGVADIDYHMPVYRFESSEVTGGDITSKEGSPAFKGKLMFGSSKKFTLGEIFESNLFGLDQSITPQVENSALLSIQGEIGLFERLDFGLKKALDSPLLYGAKFQFFGETERARKKGFSGSVFFYYGNGTKDEDGIGLASISSGNQVFQATVDITAYDGGISLGYRSNENFIFYITGYHSVFDTDSQLNSSNFGNNNITGFSRTLGGLAGFRYDFKEGKQGIMIEGGVAQGEFENTVKDTEGVVATAYTIQI